MFSVVLMSSRFWIPTWSGFHLKFCWALDASAIKATKGSPRVADSILFKTVRFSVAKKGSQDDVSCSTERHVQNLLISFAMPWGCARIFSQRLPQRLNSSIFSAMACGHGMLGPAPSGFAPATIPAPNMQPVGCFSCDVLKGPVLSMEVF